MNLIEFSQLISSKVVDDKLFSREVALYDILLGNCKNSDILDINISESDHIFTVTLLSDELAHTIEERLDNQIIPGAFQPLYKISLESNKNILKFKLIDF